MIEWLIFIAIVLITSEIIFLKWGDSDDWFHIKIFSLFIGILVSLILFGVPYLYAYGCNHDWILNSYDIIEDCVNHGPQVFFWFYGIIIAVVLFFWLNKKLLQWKEINDGKKNRD